MTRIEENERNKNKIFTEILFSKNKQKFGQKFWSKTKIWSKFWPKKQKFGQKLRFLEIFLCC